MSFVIDAMKISDADAVLAIYAEGIATGDATFETELPSWEKWDAAHHKHSRLVTREGETVLGWAALCQVSVRPVYSGVAEVSIYVGGPVRGKGVGNALMKALIESSEQNGIWTLQAGIFPENTASIALHLRHGFREVGRRDSIGRHKGIWRDTVLLERRSQSF